MNSRKRSIPYFSTRLNFNVAQLSDTINFRQDAVRQGQMRNFTANEFEKQVSNASFGLFGGQETQATPSVRLDEVMPKPEDYVKIPYRFLTQTVVGAHSWKSTDFRKEGVLKASLVLFDGTPIFSDHETAANNAAGIVTGSRWQEEVNLDGLVIPAGINADATLDSKIQFALIRNILSGAIRSNSVSVQFFWQPSHTFEAIYDFYEKLGTYDKEGKIITREVLEIQDYHESSMLYKGADPFAKKLDAQGNPERIDHTSVSYSAANPVEKENYDKKKTFFVSSSFSKEELISLSTHNQQNEKVETPPNTTDNMKQNQFLLAFVKAFGPALGISFAAPTNGEFTDAQETEAIAALAKYRFMAPEQEKVVSFATGLSYANEAGEISTFNPQVATGDHVVMTKAAHTAVLGKVTKLETDLNAANVSLGAGLKTKQDFAVGAYNKALGEKANAAIANLIQNATGDTLEAFITQYGGDAAMKYSATCTKCESSEHIQMRSSIETPEDTYELAAPSDGNIFKDLDYQGNFSRVRR